MWQCPCSSAVEGKRTDKWTLTQQSRASAKTFGCIGVAGEWGTAGSPAKRAATQRQDQPEPVEAGVQAALPTTSATSSRPPRLAATQHQTGQISPFKTKRKFIIPNHYVPALPIALQSYIYLSV